VLFHSARAAVYDGPRALPPQARSSLDDYLTKSYIAYHGDASGLDALKAAARTSAFPPAGFSIARGSPKSALASVYVNSQDPGERLQLNPSNGTFSLVEGGQSFSGTFAVNGNVLRLRIAQLAKDVDIAIDGNRLVVNGSEIWNAADGASPPAPQPAGAQAAQQQSSQDTDGVWVGFYGTCPSDDLVIFKPTIYSNTVELARLACNTYFWVAARPGTYKFCATKGKCTMAEIGASGPYYFRVLPTMISYSIGQVDASVAEDEMHGSPMTALDLSRVLARQMVTTNTAKPPAVFLSPQ
jgi:hypothetical protein